MFSGVMDMGTHWWSARQYCCFPPHVWTEFPQLVLQRPSGLPPQQPREPVHQDFEPDNVWCWPLYLWICNLPLWKWARDNYPHYAWWVDAIRSDQIRSEEIFTTFKQYLVFVFLNKFRFLIVQIHKHKENVIVYDSEPFDCGIVDSSGWYICFNEYF